MAERAHPDILGFKKEFKIKWQGLKPKIQVYPSPYSKAFYWRYKWANQYCKNKNVLEVPCGMGWGTSLLKSPKSIIGLDISKEAIEEAKSRYGCKKRIFQTSNMDKLDFQDSSFDVVLCLEGIEHVDQETGNSFLIESHRVLKKDGLLLVSTPRHKSKEHSGNPYHIIEYKLQDIIEKMSIYFDINYVFRREVDDLNIYFIVAQKLIENK